MTGKPVRVVQSDAMRATGLPVACSNAAQRSAVVAFEY